MTHRLRTPTRVAAAATAATALLSVVDVLDTIRSGWVVPVIALLGLGALAMLRVAEAGITVTDETVTVRNVTTTRVLDRVDVVGFEAGSWNSRVVLADGSVVFSLLRDEDVAGALELPPVPVPDLTELDVDAPAAPVSRVTA